jgi:hypothetical protein
VSLWAAYCGSSKIARGACRKISRHLRIKPEFSTMAIRAPATRKESAPRLVAFQAPPRDA